MVAILVAIVKKIATKVLCIKFLTYLCLIKFDIDLKLNNTNHEKEKHTGKISIIISDNFNQYLAILRIKQNGVHI